MNLQKLLGFLLLTVCSGISIKSNATTIDTGSLRIATPPVMQYLIGQAPEYQTLVKALNAANLVETIESTVPFTMFAPLNVAFTDLPFGTIDELLKPVNKDSLQHILTGHIIAGVWSIEKLAQAIKEKGGELSLPAIDGTKMLTFTTADDQVFINDRRGNKIALSAPASCANGLVFPMPDLLGP